MKAICKKCKFITTFYITERCRNENHIKTHEEWFDYVSGEQQKEWKEYGFCFIVNSNGDCPYFEEKESINICKFLRIFVCSFITNF